MALPFLFLAGGPEGFAVEEELDEAAFFEFCRSVAGRRMLSHKIVESLLVILGQQKVELRQQLNVLLASGSGRHLE